MVAILGMLSNNIHCNMMVFILVGYLQLLISLVPTHTWVELTDGIIDLQIFP